jgi:hypothetical protein
MRLNTGAPRRRAVAATARPASAASGRLPTPPREHTIEKPERNERADAYADEAPCAYAGAVEAERACGLARAVLERGLEGRERVALGARSVHGAWGKGARPQTDSVVEREVLALGVVVNVGGNLASARAMSAGRGKDGWDARTPRRVRILEWRSSRRWSF